jgi:hypothetical protein
MVGSSFFFGDSTHLSVFNNLTLCPCITQDTFNPAHKSPPLRLGYKPQSIWLYTQRGRAVAALISNDTNLKYNSPIKTSLQWEDAKSLYTHN